VRALRLVVAGGVVAAVVTIGTAPAQAVGTGGAWTNGEDVGAGAREDGGESNA
jgi:hypothetical protein